MTADDDKADDQPATAAGDSDGTAVVADSPRTVAAELHSEAPTTVVPDVGPTYAAELAWSSEAETVDYAAPTQRYTWTATWRNAGMLFVCAALLAGAIGFGGWQWAHHRDTGTAPTAAPPSARRSFHHRRH